MTVPLQSYWTVMNYNAIDMKKAVINYQKATGIAREEQIYEKIKERI